MTNANLPEDSVLRRHAMQMQQREAASPATSRTETTKASVSQTQPRESKGFLGQLLDKVFGRS